MPRRKLCVVTGGRAEYGLLCGLMKEIWDDTDLELSVIATGSHFSPEHGLTYRAIEADGFHINTRVEMLLASSSRNATIKSMGLGVIGFADAYDSLRPDIVVVLGDRFEILAAVQAALVAGIPIAHIHGGEVTEGAIDDSIRHAITKMSHLHFVAAEPYRKRAIQLGESPERVFNFGAPAVDNVARTDLLSPAELGQFLKLELSPEVLLVTYHPVTLSNRSDEAAVQELLRALDRFPRAKLVFTMPNADPGREAIAEQIRSYAARQPERAVAVASLGARRYLSAMACANVVVGNSSSGIIEAPLFKTPTVNIGERQRGRLKAESIIDAAEDEASIAAAISQALSAEFRSRLPNVKSLYGAGQVNFRIKEVLKTTSLEGLLFKQFKDLP